MRQALAAVKSYRFRVAVLGPAGRAGWVSSRQAQGLQPWLQAPGPDEVYFIHGGGCISVINVEPE